MTDDLDPAAVERAAEAAAEHIGWQAGMYDAIRAALAAAGPLVTPKAAPCCTGPVTLRLDGTWIVEEHQHHTCGAGPGSGAGHEPGCGLVPLADVARDLAEHDAQVAARAWDEGFTKGFYAAQVMPLDADASESSVPNPYERQEQGR